VCVCVCVREREREGFKHHEPPTHLVCASLPEIVLSILASQGISSVCYISLIHSSLCTLFFHILSASNISHSFAYTHSEPHFSPWRVRRVFALCTPLILSYVRTNYIDCSVSNPTDSRQRFKAS